MDSTHTDYAKKYFACNASGSGQRYALSVEALNSFPVPMIPLRDQERIGKIFSALDKKIELNRRVNQNLEAMAKQLYDYWFVQFDFPNEEGKPYKSSGGEMVWNEKLKRNIPTNWETTELGNTCEILLGGTPDTGNNNYWGGSYPWLNSGEVAEFPILKSEKTITEEGLNSSATAYAPKGSVTLSITRHLRPSILAIDACINQSVVAIKETEKIRKEYLYPLINREIPRFMKLRTGAQQPHINKETVESTWMAIPTLDILDKYYTIVEPIYCSIVENAMEMEYLIKQRDELLPFLMNGQVSVNSDLAVLYIIYKDINIRIMKENIIQAIVAKMQRDLDCRQMARLKVVLASELHNVEIVEKEDCSKQQAQENEHLLSSFISAKKIEGCSDKTLAYYRNTIERLLLTLSIAICHITTSDIRAYLSDYQEEHQSSKVTIDNMRRIFSSFFAWLEDEDYIAKSPVRRIHKVKTDSLVKEVLSDEQLEQLRDSCTNKRDLALIDILSSTGIRVGELVKLNREDIDFHERQCIVFGKGNKERIVYFNARTKLHLQQYLDERTDDNPALFVSLHLPHTRLTISGVEVRIRELGKSLSMPKVHPHKFRRTLATMAIDKGMPIEQVQRLLGHVRIDTTLHYAIVNQNNVKLAHKKYLG